MYSLPVRAMGKVINVEDSKHKNSGCNLCTWNPEPQGTLKVQTGSKAMVMVHKTGIIIHFGNQDRVAPVRSINIAHSKVHIHASPPLFSIPMIQRDLVICPQSRIWYPLDNTAETDGVFCAFTCWPTEPCEEASISNLRHCINQELYNSDLPNLHHPHSYPDQQTKIHGHIGMFISRYRSRPRFSYKRISRSRIRNRCRYGYTMLYVYMRECIP